MDVQAKAPETLIETLRQVTIAPRVIEEFRPLGESLEWRLSEQYWLGAGTRGFIEEGVPYSATSGGELSAAAAELLLANCRENPPEGEFVVLELCAGSALFARLFLDAFQRLCVGAGCDFHERIVYYATDRSPATLEQWQELGVLKGMRAVPGLGDARRPLHWQTPSGPVELRSVRAAICNYGLDSLPAAILRRGEAGPEEMCIRTNLSGDDGLLRRHRMPSLESLRERAARTDADLLPLADLFEVEAAFFPCRREYPMMHEALEAFGDAPRTILNYGAIECLQTLLPALDAAGFLLVNDYGVVETIAPVTHSCAQQFGQSKAVGLHFPMLARCASLLGAEMVAPEGAAETSLHARVLVRGAVPETRAAFQRVFSDPGWTPYRDRAQEHVQAGAIEMAREQYALALQVCPRDWSLLGEVAEFLIRQTGDFQAGLDMAQTALTLNPWYSTWLWNVYGDAQYGRQDYEQALAAYQTAERMAPRDVRTQVNLSYAYSILGAVEEALLAIARGFAYDGSGEFHDRLKEKQQQILGTLRTMRNDVAQAKNRRAKRLSSC